MQNSCNTNYNVYIPSSLIGAEFIRWRNGPHIDINNKPITRQTIFKQTSIYSHSFIFTSLFLSKPQYMRLLLMKMSQYYVSGIPLWSKFIHLCTMLITDKKLTLCQQPTPKQEENLCRFEKTSILRNDETWGYMFHISLF